MQRTDNAINQGLHALLQNCYGAVDDNGVTLESKAFDALAEVGRRITNIPVTVESGDGTTYSCSLEYIYHVEFIYFELLNGRYSSACNEVDKYLYFHPITERRIRDALISVFKKFKIV